ncbi:MAG TPA: hypothetical protein VK582_12550 [Pyrinomonadaceae bacterium]|nr:hypothetical protein [Pyrinomonadaceae bacterium]
MKARRAILSLLVLALLTAGGIGYYRWRRVRPDGNTNANANTQARKTRRKLMIVWWDITKSLYASEQENGLNWGATIISNLPAHSVYYFFPINSATQRPSPLDQGEKPAIDSPEAAVLFKGALEKRISDNVEKLRNQMRADDEAAKNYGGVVQRDKRTCILSALDYSGTILKNEAKELEPEIVFISDMVEDCLHQSLNKGKGAFIQLTQPDVDSEIRAASAIPLNLQLEQVWVTVIVPTASSDTPVSQRPDMNGLQRFWRATFQRCGLNADKYQWSIGVLPPRLISPPPATLPGETQAEPSNN